jgi:hypothetical protein
VVASLSKDLEKGALFERPRSAPCRCNFYRDSR